MLPGKLELVECHTVDSLVHAIKTMQIRGAPAIGVAGAMGIAIAAHRASRTTRSKRDLLKRIEKDANALEKARPTAVNLAWGVRQAITFLGELSESIDSGEASKKVIEFVKNLADKDVSVNKKLSKIGQELIRDNARILTHCK